MTIETSKILLVEILSTQVIPMGGERGGGGEAEGVKWEP